LKIIIKLTESKDSKMSFSNKVEQNHNVGITERFKLLEVR